VHPASFSLQRLFAYTIREGLELLRDPIRLGFALFGTAFLMLVFGFGISTDVDNLSFAVLDRDQSHESRGYLEELRGSPYFVEKAPLADYADVERRLETGDIRAASEIPPGFGRDIARGRPTWVGASIDGAMPFRAQTIRGYLQGMHQLYLTDPAVKAGFRTMPQPAAVEIRFKYNQAFESIYAMVPSTISMMLALFPAILMALAIVREKELGSITNLYVTPVTRLEFLLGKQLPYIAVAMANFTLMFVMALFVFRVPLKGSLPRAAQGQSSGLAARRADLCHDDDRLWNAGVLIHPNADRGAVRDRHSDGSARDDVLGHDGAGVRSVGHGADHGPRLSDGLFPAGQRRHLHQRPRVSRPRAESCRPCSVHPSPNAAQPAAVAQAGTLNAERADVMGKLGNIFWLGTKELRSFLRDFVLLGLVIYAFSVAIISQAQSSSQEVHNASLGIVDEDQSELSRRIAHAFLPPYFQKPQPIAERDIVPLMNAGKYTFVIDIPPNFQRDVLGRRRPAIQLNVDATAMVQAGLGSGYAQQIITTEISDFLSRVEGAPLPPVNLAVRIAFNPNVTSAWFTSVMGIINNVTMLAIILAGAAIVREREHGTMDHLLVMPLTPFEIAMSKIWANGLVITVAAGLSLTIVVRWLLGVPIAGSIPLFMCGVMIYLFFATAVGIFLGTIARSMPQLGLLFILVQLPMNMLSGSNTPLESMPSWLATIMQASPSTHFVSFAQAILYRGAGFPVVWPQFAIVAFVGGLFLALALLRFRKVAGESL
jgi:ABC-type multidrug transport system permease subunit